MKYIGIDLGTTNSSAYFIDDMDKVVTVVPSFKSMVDSATNEVLFKPTASTVHHFKVDLPHSKAVQYSSGVLAHIKKTSSMDFDGAVITVPAYFTTTMRSAVLDAAEIASIKVVGIISEPTAAAISGFNVGSKKYRLIYDLGGGTFDVSLVKKEGKMYQVLATDGLILGGRDLDRLLNLDSFNSDEIKKNGELNKYREATRIIFEPTIGKAISVLSNLATDDLLDLEFILVGGSTLNPHLQDMLKERFPMFEIKLHPQPMDAIGIGAAVFANLKSKGTADELVKDISKNISIRRVDGTVIPILHSKTVLPAQSQEIFSNAEDTEVLTLAVYEGNGLTDRTTTYIGELKHSYTQKVTKDMGVVVVEASLNTDGILVITSKDFGGGNIQTKTFNLKGVS